MELDNSSLSPTSQASLPDLGLIIPQAGQHLQAENDNFTIVEQLDKGRFGAVFKCKRSTDNKEFALKLEFCNSRSKGLHAEYAVLRSAAKYGLQNFCAYYDRGKIADQYIFIIIELMTVNLYHLRWRMPNGYFSLATGLRLAKKTLKGIEELHSIGIIHRDIKASNFLFSTDSTLPDRCRVCISDFGLSRKFAEPKNDGEEGESRPSSFRGTTAYASIAAHRNELQSPKDDLESWFYMVVEMLTGQLPWSTLHRDDRPEVLRLKLALRKKDDLHELLRACPRHEFRRILAYIDGLTLHNRPDYLFIAQLLQLAMRNHSVNNADQPYDWEQG